MLLLLSSCATTGKLSTSSGKPEITIRNSTLNRIKDLCVASLLQEGYIVDKSSEYSMLMFKPEEGGGFFNTPDKRHEASFNFVTADGGIKVYHTVTTIVRPGSEYPTYDLQDSQEELEEQQARLQRIADEANK